MLCLPGQCLSQAKCSIGISCFPPLIVTVPTQYPSLGKLRATHALPLSASSQTPQMSQAVRKKVVTLAPIFRGFCPLLGACGEAAHHSRVLWLEESAYLMVPGKQKKETNAPQSPSRAHSRCLQPPTGPHLLKILSPPTARS